MPGTIHLQSVCFVNRKAYLWSWLCPVVSDCLPFLISHRYSGSGPRLKGLCRGHWKFTKTRVLEPISEPVNMTSWWYPQEYPLASKKAVPERSREAAFGLGPIPSGPLHLCLWASSDVVSTPFCSYHRDTQSKGQGLQPAAAFYSLLSLSLCHAHKACPRDSWMFWQGATSLLYKHEFTNPADASGTWQLFLAPFADRRQKGKERERTVFTTPVTMLCHLNPGILREPCSHPSASASFWGNICPSRNDMNEGKIQMSESEPERMLKCCNS